MFCNPEPRSELNDEPPILRLVVEAVMKDEYAVDEEYGKSSPPEKVILVEVALDGNGYAKVVKLASLLNHDSLTDEEAIVFTLPLVPV